MPTWSEESITAALHLLVFIGLIVAAQEYTLGLSVVPLVYMMVHRSSGLGGMGGEGLSNPSLAKASKLNTCMPSASVSCMTGTLITNYVMLHALFEWKTDPQLED